MNVKKEEKEKEPTVLQKHARILRERLAWVHKKSPPAVQKYVHDSLLQYADAIKDYCNCPERSYLDREKRFACLDCGKRHRVAKGKEPLRKVE